MLWKGNSYARFEDEANNFSIILLLRYSQMNLAIQHLQVRFLPLQMLLYVCLVEMQFIRTERYSCRLNQVSHKLQM